MIGGIAPLEAHPVLGGAAPHRDELVDLVVGLGVQRLALVERERAGEIVAAALADVGDAAQRGGALERRLRAPSRRTRALAAAIARRASSRSPWATGPSCSPVAGLVASATSPESASSHAPAMNMRVGALVLVAIAPTLCGAVRVSGMADERYDFIIVGGGSAGCALGNRPERRPVHNACSCWRRAGSDYAFDVFIHMPAALPFPIGSRFYDWKYESEPEPYMNGRRVYHARGKVLGGSSSINGMIFQRGNPMDYERWAADPGMETGTTRTACRTSSAWRRASRAPTSAAAATGRSCSSAARRRTRCSAPSSRPSQQAGYPLTDDVNGYRQEGFAPFDRNIHNGRRLQRRAGLPAPGDGPPEPRRRDRARSSTRSCSRDARDRRRVLAAAGAAPSGRTATRSILCGGAINSPQLLQLSGVGNAATCGRSGSTSSHDLPGVGENLQDHLEVYIQYALASSRSRCSRHEVAEPAAHRRRVAVPAHSGPARRTTSRPAASCAATTTSSSRT